MPKYHREASGGIGCFTADSFPVFDHFNENATIIADSNHGWKMLGVGHLIADEVLGETNGASLPAGDYSTVGVDVLGPGGGQFSVSYSSDGIVGVTRGLPNDNVPLLRLTLEDLAKIREQPEDVAEQFVSMLDQVPADSAESVAAELLEVLSKDGQLTSAG